MTEGGGTELRALFRALQAWRGEEPRSEDSLGERTIRRALDVLERDLLPRTAGSHDHLVAGIVGPNNAGKSALFNSAVAGIDSFGAPAPVSISPSLPTGGATRRLVGALHPALRAVLDSEPTLQRFAMRCVTPGPEGVTGATLAAAPDAAAELLLVETTTLPESLLLVDTPDFDSVLRDNRVVTDALLTVADVAIVVVTRHTYQNHDVIEFLRDWLAHGRPWVLVYNESIDLETTTKHAQKITEDLGGVPEAVFHSPFDVEIARGARALVPVRLDATRTHGSAGEGTSISAWLRDLGARRDLKARALSASVRGLRGHLEELWAETQSVEHGVEEAMAMARGHALQLGRATAREAMPMGPFLEAFREVLDERPTAVQRELRRGLRWTSAQVTGTARWISSKVRGGDGPKRDSAEGIEATLLDAEWKELEARWSQFFEPALKDLRAASRQPGLAPVLAGALGSTAKDASPQEALEAVKSSLGLDAEMLKEYRAACREIIAAELDAGGSEWLLQLGVDALHLLPIGVAGAVIVHTGGMGADLAVAGGGALSAAAAERLSRALGTGVAMSARAKWTDLRAEKIAEAALHGLVGPSLEELSLRARSLGVLARQFAHVSASGASA